MWIWAMREHAWMGQEVRADLLCSLKRLTRLEITKQDREDRKKAIDAETERLIYSGSSKTGAKKTATERWDAAHPWFKADTHGKTAKSKSYVALTTSSGKG